MILHDKSYKPKACQHSVPRMAYALLDGFLTSRVLPDGLGLSYIFEFRKVKDLRLCDHYYVLWRNLECMFRFAVASIDLRYFCHTRINDSL